MNPTVQPHPLATRVASPPQELSQRQEEVLALIAEALSNKQIAHRLGISEATVKAHISKTIQVTGCRNRVGLALLWHQKTGRLTLT
jgi:DNA-binding NarL/FixJ family response regulator